MKLIIWHAVVALVAFGLWLDVAKWFQALTLNKSFVSYAVVMFAFLVSLVILGFILFEKKWLVLSFGVLAGLTFILNFGWSSLNFVGLLILLLVCLKSRSDVTVELFERTKINIQVILRRGVAPVILSLFILISFAAYQSSAFEKFTQLDRLPSSTEKYVKIIVENIIGQQIQGASEKEKNMIINQVSKEAISQINGWVGPYLKYSPPILAFTLFLTLWSLSWIFIWLSVWVGMLMFWTLKKVGFVKIEEKEIKAEVLVI